MEPTLMVVGVNYRTAPVEVRERFFISEGRRCEAVVQLAAAEAVDEAVVLATCNRTEFIVWTRDVSTASNSVLNFLTQQCGLKLCEWKHFYRLMDEAALAHVFKVTSSLDSMIVGEPEIVAQVKAAWTLAQQAHTCGRFLDAVFQKALSVSKRVRTETNIGHCAVSIPYAAVELARHIFASLSDRTILLMGAGKMSELSAQYLRKFGATDVRVISRTMDAAQQLANQLGGRAVAMEDRWQQLLDADIVISSTSCPHVIFTREEAERLRDQRNGRPLLLVDIAVPRDIDPAVKEVHGIFLYNIDDLEEVVKRNTGEREAAAHAAQEIVTHEAKFFRRRLVAEHVVPTIVALRSRLDQLGQQEFDRFLQELGPFAEDQQRVLQLVSQRVTQRIAGYLARELKELPEKGEQEQLAAAVQKLFHLNDAENLVVASD